MILFSNKFSNETNTKRKFYCKFVWFFIIIFTLIFISNTNSHNEWGFIIINRRWSYSYLQIWNDVVRTKCGYSGIDAFRLGGIFGGDADDWQRQREIFEQHECKYEEKIRVIQLLLLIFRKLQGFFLKSQKSHSTKKIYIYLIIYIKCKIWH